MALRFFSLLLININASCMPRRAFRCLVQYLKSMRKRPLLIMTAIGNRGDRSICRLLKISCALVHNTAMPTVPIIMVVRNSRRAMHRLNNTAAIMARMISATTTVRWRRI